MWDPDEEAPCAVLRPYPAHDDERGHPLRCLRSQRMEEASCMQGEVGLAPLLGDEGGSHHDDVAVAGW